MVAGDKLLIQTLGGQLILAAVLPEGYREYGRQRHSRRSPKFLLYRDDGTGRVAERLAEFEANADPTFVPGTGGHWVLGDTYAIDGFQHLFLFHQPSRLFLPLAKLKTTALENGMHRVDLHAGPPAMGEPSPSIPATKAWGDSCTSS